MEEAGSVSVCTEIINGSLANNGPQVRFGIGSSNNGTATGTHIRTFENCLTCTNLYVSENMFTYRWC